MPWTWARLLVEPRRPDVSRAALFLLVKELEAELGVALFTRSGRRLRNTTAGAALLESARQVLRDLEAGQAALEAVNGLKRGKVMMAGQATLLADPGGPLVGPSGVATRACGST